MFNTTISNVLKASALPEVVVERMN